VITCMTQDGQNALCAPSRVLVRDVPLSANPATVTCNRCRLILMGHALAIMQTIVTAMAQEEQRTELKT
jgi:hypothetical protein